MVPDAERPELLYVADPDRDVPEMPGNKPVGQTKRRFLEQDVQWLQRLTNMLSRPAVVVQQPLAVLIQPDRIAVDQAEEIDAFVLHFSDEIAADTLEKTELAAGDLADLHLARELI